MTKISQNRSGRSAWIVAGFVCCLSWPVDIVAGEPCVPAALVDGDSDSIEAIEAMLAQRGVSITRTEGCPATVAHVNAREGKLEVSVEQPDHANETRIVSDAVTAATVIESWTRGVLANPLLEPKVIEPTEKAAPVFATPALVAEVSQPVGEKATDRGLSVGGAFYLGRGSDASTWLEPEFGACVYVSQRWCLNAQVRGRFDTQVSGDSTAFDTNRIGVDVLIGAEFLASLDPHIVVGPSVGAGWLRSRYSGEEAGGDVVDVDSGGLRIGAHVAWFIPADDHLNLMIGANTTYAPLARTEPSLQDGLPFAGEASWVFSVGLGIAYGTP